MPQETVESVVFVQGIHYPTDSEGHADLTRPLRWDPAAGAYRDAEDGEAMHNDVHGTRVATVDASTIQLHSPGLNVYPVGAHVVSSDAETYYLADEHGRHVDGVPLRWDAETQTFRPKEETP